MPDRPVDADNFVMKMGGLVLSAAAIALLYRYWWKRPAPIVVVTPDFRIHLSGLVPINPFAGAAAVVRGPIPRTRYRLQVFRQLEWSHWPQTLPANDPNSLTIDAIALSPDGKTLSISSSDTYDGGVELMSIATSETLFYRTDNLFRYAFLPAVIASTDADVPPYLATMQAYYDQQVADPANHLMPKVLTARESEAEANFAEVGWTASGGWRVDGYFGLAIDGDFDPPGETVTFWVVFELVDGSWTMVDRGFAKPPPPFLPVPDFVRVTKFASLVAGGLPVKMPSNFVDGVVLSSGPWPATIATQTEASPR